MKPRVIWKEMLHIYQYHNRVASHVLQEYSVKRKKYFLFAGEN